MYEKVIWLRVIRITGWSNALDVQGLFFYGDVRIRISNWLNVYNIRLF